MMSNLRKARNVALSFTSFVLSLVAVVSLISMLAASGKQGVGRAAPLPEPVKGKKTMRSFGSDEELRAYLKKLAEEQRRDARRGAKSEADASAAPAATANQAAGLAKAGADSKDDSI